MSLWIKRNLFTDIVDEFRPLRPSPDQAHVPAQYIKYLWQLVNSVFSHDGADTGHAVIFFGRPNWFASRLGIDPHAAEFQYLEHALVLAYTFLAIQDGLFLTALQAYGKCGGRKYWQRHYQ